MGLRVNAWFLLQVVISDSNLKTENGEATECRLYLNSKFTQVITVYTELVHLRCNGWVYYNVLCS